MLQCPSFARAISWGRQGPGLVGAGRARLHWRRAENRAGQAGVVAARALLIPPLLVLGSVSAGLGPARGAPEAAYKPRRVNPALRNIPENTWVRMLPAEKGPWKRNYSGMCFDSNAGRVLYWGGGHFSYPGNEVQAYIVGEKRWVSLDDRCVPPLPVRWGGSGVSGPDPFGRPFAAHTCADLVFDPAGNQMLWMAHHGAIGVWTYDLTRKVWRQHLPA